MQPCHTISNPAPTLVMGHSIQDGGCRRCVDCCCCCCCWIAEAAAAAAAESPPSADLLLAERPVGAAAPAASLTLCTCAAAPSEAADAGLLPGALPVATALRSAPSGGPVAAGSGTAAAVAAAAALAAAFLRARFSAALLSADAAAFSPSSAACVMQCISRLLGSQSGATVVHSNTLSYAICTASHCERRPASVTRVSSWQGNGCCLDRCSRLLHDIQVDRHGMIHLRASACSPAIPAWQPRRQPVFAAVLFRCCQLHRRRVPLTLRV
jgi:hypothetical protein